MNSWNFISFMGYVLLIKVSVQKSHPVQLYWYSNLLVAYITNPILLSLFINNVYQLFFKFIHIEYVWNCHVFTVCLKVSIIYLVMHFDWKLSFNNSLCLVRCMCSCISWDIHVKTNKVYNLKFLAEVYTVNVVVKRRKKSWNHRQHKS